MKFTITLPPIIAFDTLLVVSVVFISGAAVFKSIYFGMKDKSVFFGGISLP